MVWFVLTICAALMLLFPGLSLAWIVIIGGVLGLWLLTPDSTKQR